MKRKARQLTGCDRDFLAELDRILDALDKIGSFDRKVMALRWACDRFGISGKALAAALEQAHS